MSKDPREPLRPRPGDDAPETSEALKKALLREGRKEAEDEAHQDFPATPEITRDPADPLGQRGTRAPRQEAPDEQTAAQKEAEAGRDLAERELAKEGRRIRPT